MSIIDLEGPSGFIPLQCLYPQTGDLSKGVDTSSMTLMHEEDVRQLPACKWRSSMQSAADGSTKDSLEEFKEYCSKTLKEKSSKARYMSVNCYSCIMTLAEEWQFTGIREMIGCYAWTSFDAEGDHAFILVPLPRPTRKWVAPRNILVKLTREAITSGAVEIYDKEWKVTGDDVLGDLQAHMLPWQKMNVTLRGLGPDGYELSGKITLSWNEFQESCQINDMSDVSCLAVKLAGMMPLTCYNGDAMSVMADELSRRLDGCSYTGTLKGRAVVRRPYSQKRGYILMSMQLSASIEAPPHEIYVKIFLDDLVNNGKLIVLEDEDELKPHDVSQHLTPGAKCDGTISCYPSLIDNYYKIAFIGTLKLVPSKRGNMPTPPCICPELASKLDLSESTVLPQRVQPVQFTCPVTRGSAPRWSGMLGGDATLHRRAYVRIPNQYGVNNRRRLSIHEGGMVKGSSLREIRNGTADICMSFGKCVTNGHYQGYSLPKLINIRPSDDSKVEMLLTTYWWKELNDQTSDFFECRFLYQHQAQEARQYYETHAVENDEDAGKLHPDVVQGTYLQPLALMTNDDVMAAKKEVVDTTAYYKEYATWSKKLQSRRGKKGQENQIVKQKSGKIKQCRKRGGARRTGRDQMDAPGKTWQRGQWRNHKATSRGSKRNLTKVKGSNPSSSTGADRRAAAPSNMTRVEVRKRGRTAPVTPVPMMHPPSWPEEEERQKKLMTEKKQRKEYSTPMLPKEYAELAYKKTTGTSWASSFLADLLRPSIDGTSLQSRFFDEHVQGILRHELSLQVSWKRTAESLKKLYLQSGAVLQLSCQEPPMTLTPEDLVAVFGDCYNKFQYPFFTIVKGEKRSLRNFSMIAVVKLYAALTNMKMMTFAHVEYYDYIFELLEKNQAYVNSLACDSYGNCRPLDICKINIADLKRRSFAERRNADTAAYDLEKIILRKALEMAVSPNFYMTWCHCHEPPKSGLALGCYWTLQLADAGESVNRSMLIQYLSRLARFSSSYRNLARDMVAKSEYVQANSKSEDFQFLIKEMKRPYSGKNTDSWPEIEIGSFPIMRNFSFMKAFAC